MTEKENVLHALRHDGEARWISNISDSVITYAPRLDRDKIKEGIDWFGVKWRDFAPLNEAIIDDVSDWEKQLKFPNLDEIDFKAEAEEQLKTFDRKNKALWIMMSQGLLDRLNSFLSVEFGLTSFYDDPDATADLMDALTDFRIKLMGKLIDAYDPDIIDFRDDYGTQTSLFFSPGIFDEFFKPRIKRICDYAHSRGKIFVEHCCGKVDQLVGRFVEIGADTWDSVQPCNNLANIYEDYGDRLGFSSNMDLQKFGDCTEDEAREIVRFYIDTLGGRNNLLLWDRFPISLPLNPDILTDEIRKYGQKGRR